jgi:hypothetical protein
MTETLTHPLALFDPYTFRARLQPALIGPYRDPFSGWLREAGHEAEHVEDVRFDRQAGEKSTRLGPEIPARNPPQNSLS